MKCQKCGRREAKIQYAEEPIFALTRGFGSKWLCRKCYIKIIEKHLIEVQKNLKEQKQLLKKENKNEMGD